MTKWIETTGRSEEDAISAALFQLGLERDDVSVEVLERAKSGFLGFGGNPAKVRVSYEAPGEDEPAAPAAEEKPAPAETPAPAPVQVQEEAPAPAPQAPEAPAEEETILAAKPGWQPSRSSRPARNDRRRREEPRRSSTRLQEGDEVLIGSSTPRPAPAPVTLSPVEEGDEKAAQIRTFLAGLMQHLDVEAVPELYLGSDGSYKVILQGQNLGAIIGRRGETLDAIQQLTNYSVNHGQTKRVRVHVDAEGYRAKREESLKHLAVKVAGKAVRFRRSMTLEPMNAYERHVIHTALQDYPGVTTYSTGVEPNRRTVVAYAPDQK